MKAFVTGVGGQLGHDVVNELKRKRWDVVGSDIHVTYCGVQDGSEVVRAPYVQLENWCLTPLNFYKRINMY